MTVPGALESLLKAENRLDAMLADERRAGEAVVLAAQEEVSELERRLESELALAAREFSQRLETERDARLAFAEAESSRFLERLRSVTPEEIDELAAWVVERVLDSVDQAVQ